jgi:DNA gyrase subunit B
MVEYDDNSIYTLEGLQPYRQRPQGYLKDMGLTGQCHLVYELISNSFDESIQASLNGTDGEYELFFFRDKEQQRYAILSRDTYRGIPLTKLHDAMLVGNTSGKYNTNAYGFSAGLYGVALKVCCALSKGLTAFSYRDGMSSNIRVHDAEETTISSELYTNTYNPTRTGLDIYYEIDKTLFYDINEMIEVGISILTDIITKIAIFFPTNKCKVYLIDNLLYNDLNLLTCDPNIFQENVDCVKNSASCITILDTNKFTQNPIEYFKYLWKIQEKITQILEIHSNTHSRIKFDIFTLTTSQILNKTIFYSVINNVLMERLDSSHVKVFFNMLKNKLLICLKDNQDLREFFLTSYKLPIYTAINVLASGVMYQGFSKESFTDRAFETEYKELLEIELNKIEETTWFKFFKSFESDLTQKFNNLMKKYTDNKTFNTLLTVLNKPQNFFDCSIKDRSLAELFLVEGGSAGAGMAKRDSITQAYLLLQGKPINVVKSSDKIPQSIELLKGNSIMQDLCKILGIQPGNSDFDKLNFGKIFLFQDADSDGRHIRELLLGDLYHINPKIIESGMVHLVIPPLYRVSSKTNPNRKFFCKDSDSLLNIKIDYIFKPAFELGISKQGSDTYMKIIDDLYTSCCYIINKVGESFDFVSSLTLIPTNMLEGLVSVYEYLSPETIDTSKIQTALKADMIKYNKPTHSIVVSIGSQDTVINLIGVVDEIKKHIIPLLVDLHWDRYVFKLTTLKNPNLFYRTPLPIMMLYKIFQKTDEFFYIERLKGLGSMKPEEAWITCLDPDTRITYPITSVGDVDTLYALLGDSAEYRKAVLNSLDLFSS